MGKNNSEISERLITLIESLGETRNSFAKKLSYSRSQAVYDITNGKSEPSSDFFRRILLSEYSEIISIEWIIGGKGSMLCEKRTIDNSKQATGDSIELNKLKTENDWLKKRIEQQEKIIENLSKKPACDTMEAV